MGDNFIYIIYAAMILLFFVLVGGLWTMLKGGQQKKSQKMMRWRLGVQGFIIVAIIVYVVFFRGG